MDTLVEADPGMHTTAFVSASMAVLGDDEAIARAQRRIAYLDHLIRFTQERSQQRKHGALPRPVADPAQQFAATLVAFRNVWLHHLQSLRRPELSVRDRG